MDSRDCGGHGVRGGVSGSQGQDLHGQDRFNVLWIEDITQKVEAQNTFARENENKNHELVKRQAMLDSVPRPLWLRD